MTLLLMPRSVHLRAIVSPTFPEAWNLLNRVHGPYLVLSTDIFSVKPLSVMAHTVRWGILGMACPKNLTIIHMKLTLSNSHGLDCGQYEHLF